MPKKALATCAAAIAATMIVAGSAGSWAAGVSMEAADKMADACIAMANEKGWKMNVAIVDSGADLVVFKRQDGAFLGSVGVAIDKATSSGKFPFSTRLIAELAHGKDGNPGPLPGIAHIAGITTFPGGLPIMNAAGEHIGGIGVSGASADDDELCAQAGIDAAKGML